jgi:Protein of unknown function (DUF1648).
MRIKRNGYDIIVNLICIGLLIGLLIYLCLSWSSIPEKLAGHYNAAGEINRWGTKGELLITPIIAWIIYIGLTIVENFPQIWNTGVQVTENNKVRIYRIIKNLLGTEKVIVVSVFTFITINQSLSKPLPIWFLPVFLVLMFGSLILFIFKLVKAK